MSCLVAAAQIGSYFGSPHDGRGSALIRICAMIGVLGPASRSRRRVLGVLDGHADRPAPALVPVVVAVQPVIGLPVVECRSTWRAAPRGSAPGRRRAPGWRCRTPASMISCLNARSGSLHGELDRPVGTCRPASRRSARSRGRRSRSGHRPCGCRSTCCATAPGGTGRVRPVRGAGWTSESTHRTAMRSAAGTRGLAVVVMSGPPRYPLLCRNRGRDGRTRFDAVQLGGVAPAQLVALFGAVAASAPSAR